MSLLHYLREEDPVYFDRVLEAQERFILDGEEDESGKLLLLASKGWRDVHRSADEHLEELTRKIRKAFKSGRKALDREKLEAALAARDEFTALSLVSDAITETAAVLGPALEDVLGKVVDASGTRAVKRLKATLRSKPGKRVAAKTTAREDEIIQEFGFDKTNPRAVEWVREHAADLVTDVSETTRTRIRELVEEAFVEGVDVRDLADQIEDIVDDADRAETIARTETMTASNEGQAEAWEQAIDEGLLTGDERKEWIVTPDDRLCPICEPMDGVQVRLDEEFETELGRVDQPPAHPRCRCTIGLAVD